MIKIDFLYKIFDAQKSFKKNSKKLSLYWKSILKYF